jgi:hypothetical protein
MEIHPIGQKHITKDAFVLVVAVGLGGDHFLEGEFRGSVLGVVAVSVAFLWTVDAAEAHTLRVLVVQDFEGVVVEDANNLANTGTLNNARSVPYCGGMRGSFVDRSRREQQT